MPGIPAEKSSDIAAACQRLGIRRLFVFGSALRDDFKPGESDIDLLVEFGPLDVTKRFHTYLAAREAFRSILQADVDLVMQGAVKNPIIAKEINRSKVLIYGAISRRIYWTSLRPASHTERSGARSTCPRL